MVEGGRVEWSGLNWIGLSTTVAAAPSEPGMGGRERGDPAASPLLGLDFLFGFACFILF